MTIQEAIKSGKPFKRKNSEEEYYRHNLTQLPDMNANITIADILATDWEVEKTFEVSDNEILNALSDYGLTPGGIGDSVLLNRLKIGYYK